MRINTVIAATLFYLISFTGISQTGIQKSLDKNSRSTIVSNISSLLLQYYVYPDTAKRMSDEITNKLKKGDYNKITDAVEFSDQLTKDLHSIYHDGHLLVQYNPKFEAELKDTSKQKPSTPIDHLKTLSNYNQGFRKVEILNGNIGYINLVKCWAGKGAGHEIMKGALAVVANCNAVIIDLRENSGGTPETATALLGFFMQERVQLESFYDRSENSVTAFWTEPDTTFPSLKNMPVYILTGNKTFSCGEMLAYDFQVLKRATLIGETTGGGAHGEFEAPLSNGFIMQVPYWKTINPITKSNWEHSGVKPDIEVTAEKALETAEQMIFEKMAAEIKDTIMLQALNWELSFLKAINHPVVIDELTLQKFAGIYGDRTFTFENGKLYYQRAGRPKFEMEPVTKKIMKGKNNTYFKIEFLDNGAGGYDEVKAYYQDNRVEFSKRTK